MAAREVKLIDQKVPQRQEKCLVRRRDNPNVLVRKVQYFVINDSVLSRSESEIVVQVGRFQNKGQTT